MRLQNVLRIIFAEHRLCKLLKNVKRTPLKKKRTTIIKLIDSLLQIMECISVQ